MIEMSETELTQSDMSEIDKAIEENKAELLKSAKPEIKQPSEAEIKAKVLAELKAKEEKDALLKKNVELEEQIKKLAENQQEQKEKFEEQLKKFSGNTSDSAYNSKSQDANKLIKNMNAEDFKAFEEAQREATLELFRKRGMK